MIGVKSLGVDDKCFVIERESSRVLTHVIVNEGNPAVRISEMRVTIGQDSLVDVQCLFVVTNRLAVMTLLIFHVAQLMNVTRLSV